MAFNLSKFGAGLGGGAKPLDPAADIARLLNQQTHHWMSLGECRGRGRRWVVAHRRAAARRRRPRCQRLVLLCRCPNRRPTTSTSHSSPAEKEIKEVKAKQVGAQAAYAAALEGREAARAALVEAEHGLAQAEAAGGHARAELESSKVGAGSLARLVTAVGSCCS